MRLSRVKHHMRFKFVSYLLHQDGGSQAHVESADDGAQGSMALIKRMGELLKELSDKNAQHESALTRKDLEFQRQIGVFLSYTHFLIIINSRILMNDSRILTSLNVVHRR